MEFKCLNEIEESQQRYMAHFDKKYNFECSKIFHNAFTETANVSSSEIKITDTSREPTDVDSHLTHEINDEFDSSELLDELEPIHIKLPDDDLSTVADENGGDSTDETLARTSMMLVPEDDLHKTKLELISYISASLLDKDILTDLYDRLQNVVLYDPEFILKLSLYAKNNLNIRLLGNTLLAFAIENIECRHFVDRYFNAIINVPTDLLTTLSKLWSRTNINYIPKKVRPCFANKIYAFSDFQLRKYRSKRVYLDDSNKSEYITLKRVIKLLHLKDNRERLMKILEKRYPQTIQEFYSSKLSGEFDENKAGKRIKFDTILTWETYVSEKGNTKESWSVLLESNAVPYVALLKNLRNICQCKLEEKHTNMVITKITDPKEIKKSRVFPMEYLTAYNALSSADTKRPWDKFISGRKKQQRTKRRHNDEDFVVHKQALNKAFRIAADMNVESLPGRTLIVLEVKSEDQEVGETAQHDYLFSLMIKSRCEFCEMYLYSAKEYLCKVDLKVTDLDAAKTIYDISEQFHSELNRIAKPEKVIDSADKNVDVDDKSKSGSNKTKSSCSKVNSDDNNDKDSDEYGHDSLDSENEDVDDKDANTEESHYWKDLTLKGDVILNVASTPKYINVTSFFTRHLLCEPESIKKIDNAFLIIRNSGKASYLFNSFNGYKGLRNQDMRRILVGRRVHTFKMKGDIIVSQVSSESLRFLSTTGVEGQLAEIDQIDKHQHLHTSTKSNIVESSYILTTMPPQIPRWKNVRLYVSFNAKESYLEWLVLKRYVIPKLKMMASKLHIDLYAIELDSDFGDMINQSDSIKIRLDEVRRSDIVLLIVGQRYNDYKVPCLEQLQKETRFHWLNSYNIPLSITECEVIHGVFERLESMYDKAFVYLKDDVSSVKPSASRELIYKVVKSHQNQLKLLHQRMHSTDNEYEPPCKCLKMNKKNVYQFAKLDEFAQNVFDNVWSAIKMINREENALTIMEGSNRSMFSRLKSAFDKHVENVNSKFVIRKLDEISRDMAISMRSPGSKVLISGRCGSGKTFLVCRFIKHWLRGNIKGINVSGKKSTMFVAIPIFTDIIQAQMLSFSTIYQCNYQRFVLYYICNEMKTYLNISLSNNDNKLSKLPTTIELFNYMRLLSSKARESSVLFLICIDSINNVMNTSIAEIVGKSLRSCASLLVVLTANSTSNKDSIIFEGDESLKRLDLFSGLDSYSKRQIVTNRISQYTGVNDRFMRILFSKQDTNIPLFLNIACHHMLFNRGEKDLAQSVVEIPHKLSILVDNTIQRIAAKYHNTSKLDVYILIALLVYNKYLSNKELVSMLYLNRILPDTVLESHFKDISSNLIEDKLHQPSELWLTFFSVLSDLDWMLGPRYDSEYVFISHQDIIDCLQAQISKKTSERASFILAFHMWTCCYSNNTWTNANSQYMIKLPKLLMRANRILELNDLLSSSLYLSNRCSLGYIDELLVDLKNALTFCPSLSDINNLLQKNSHLLRKYPNEYYSIVKPKIQIFNDGSCSISHIHHHKFAIETMKVQGDIVALGCADGVIKLISLKKCSCIAELTGHSSSVNCLTFFGSEMSLLASGSRDCKLCFWDYLKNIRLKVFSHHRLQLSDVIVTAHNELVASSDLEGCICTYTTGSMAFVNSWLVESKSPISCLQDYDEERLLIALTWANVIYIYEPYGGECREMHDIQWATQICVLANKKFLTLTGHQTLAVNYIPNEHVNCSSIIQNASCLSVHNRDKLCIGHSDGSVALYKLSEAEMDCETFKDIKFVEQISAGAFGVVLSQTNGMLHKFSHYYPAGNVLKPKSSKMYFTIANYDNINAKPVNVVDICVHGYIASILYKPGSVTYIQYLGRLSSSPYRLQDTSIQNARKIVHRVINENDDDKKNVSILLFYLTGKILKMMLIELTIRYTIVESWVMSKQEVETDSSNAVIGVADAVQQDTDGALQRIYFAFANDLGTMQLLYWDIKHRIVQSVCKKDNLDQSFSGVSILDSKHQFKPRLLTISSTFDGANISWWNDNLTCFRTVGLSSDPPLNLFGTLLVLQSGLCRKYSSIKPYNTVLWECKINFGNKLAYSPGYFDTVSCSIINEKLYTIVNGQCVGYSLPPLKTILPKSLFHNDAVTSVYINDMRILSCSRDGTLAMYDQREQNQENKSKIVKRESRSVSVTDRTVSDGIKQMPISVDISFYKNITCVILFPNGNLCIWRKHRNDLNWKFERTLKTSLVDATYAIDKYSTPYLYTSRGLRYEFRNMNEFSVDESENKEPLFPLLPIVSVSTLHEQNTYIASTSEIKAGSHYAFYLHKEFGSITKFRKYFSRIWDFPEEKIFICLSLDYSELAISYSFKLGYGTRSFHQRNTIYLTETNDTLESNESPIQIANNSCICIVPQGDGKFQVIIGDVKGYIHKFLIDKKQYNAINTIKSKQSTSDIITCVEYTSKSDIIWTGSSNYTIQLWNSEDLSKIKSHRYYSTGIPSYIVSVPDKRDEVVVACSNGDVFPVEYFPN